MVVAKKQTDKPKESFGGLVKLVGQVLVVVLVIRTLFFQSFVIPTSSMVPTLLVGDYLFVSKMSYGYSKYSIPFSPNLFSGRIFANTPERGDVAVFRFPPDPNIDYIKRVIGLPGDKVQMRNGVLFINDVAVKRELVDRSDFATHKKKNDFLLYRETLPNGVTYLTWDLGNSQADDTKVFEVPQEHFFMMGDNRDNSNDSRFDVGYVPFENFVGQAKIIYFSINENASFWQFWKWPWTIHFSRIFQSL